MADEQQLRLDLEDLRHLQSVAKRPGVASLLASEIRSLEAKVNLTSLVLSPFSARFVSRIGRDFCFVRLDCDFVGTVYLFDGRCAVVCRDCGNNRG